MTGDEIREAFLRFYESKGHLRMPSSSLIPAGDPTLLLTNAGMVQFKPYFTGEMTPPGPRLTTAQKCFRTTDIDSVGDSTHLTFFEMLGNFSVGDYFKKEAIAYAWEFVTEHLKLEPERLWTTVFEDDDEAFGYWIATGVPAERIRRCSEKDNFWGPAGSEGPCGPCSEIHYDFGAEYGCHQPDCGPNCENIAADTGLKPALSAAERCDRFVELWNLVFMQFYQAQDGSRTPLPAPNIDTGMGLERCAVILQGKRSIYDTDLFQPIIQKVADLCGKQYGQDTDTDYAIRVVAEHARSAAFLIADSVVPGRDGRDYILRRILRRAVFYGMQLGRSGRRPGRGFGETGHWMLYMPGDREVKLTTIMDAVIQTMGSVYPELSTRSPFIKRIVSVEEEAFLRTLKEGDAVLRQIMAFRETLFTYWNNPQDLEIVIENVGFLPVIHKEIIKPFLEAKQKGHLTEGNVNKLSGHELFLLHATYGFPIELTKEAVLQYHPKPVQQIRSRPPMPQFEFDEEGFERELEAHQEISRAAAGKFGGDFDAVRVYQDLGIGQTRFLGYETLNASSVVVGLLIDGQQVSHATEGQQVEVVLRETPFYAEMGGQMGDAGEIAGEGSALRVEDTQAPIAGLTVHKCTVVSGSISLGDTVEARVDPRRRQDIARNHTATHMLHAALRQVLGTHVRQHGSLVTPDRLRFDFTHVSPLSPEELREVQRLTNEKIRENITVSSQETTYRQAVSQGALAFFGDRYGDRVRMVEVADPSTGSGQAAPFSLEVCGGTHVHRTGDIGLCHIVSESSIGSGLRRIEAVTGRAAEELMALQSATLEELSRRLQVSPDQLASRIADVLAQMEQTTRQAETLERELLKRQVAELPRKQVAGINVVSGELKVSAVELLREAGDWLKNDVKSGVVALGAVLEGRPTMLIMATRDVVDQGFHAGNVVKEAAKVMGGGGGGRPEMGQAGGRDPGKLKDALRAAEEEVRRWRRNV